MVSLYDWLRVVLVTAVMIPLVYLFTRYFGRRFTGTMCGRNFAILEQFSVDQHNRLILARLINKFYVLSSSAKGLEVLVEITDPELVAELTEQARKPESGSSWFQALFNQRPQ